MTPLRTRQWSTITTLLLTALVIGGADLPAQDTTTAGPQPDYGAVIAAIEERVPRLMRQNGVPGMAIALVDGGSVIWAKGYGRTADSLPITDTTLFSVQSISKTYTAAVVLRAVELGWLGLDDPLIEHLPEFTVRSRFGPHEVARITIRHLLAHRACLPHEAPVGGSFEDSNAPFEAHIRSITESWLLCPVGSRYSYSNLGFDLAGYVLERIRHRPFAEIADSLLLRPLGMTRSTFDFRKVRDLGPVTDGHIGTRVLPLQGIPIIPSGGLYSTVRDMGRFVASMITEGESGGGRVLSARHMAEMGTPQFRVPGQTAGYGLGLQSVPAFGAVRFSHSGGGLGFSAEQRWMPAYRIGVIVLANQQENASTSGIAAGVIQLMLRAKLGAEPRDTSVVAQADSGAALPLERLRRLEGEYKSTGGPLVWFSLNGGRLQHISGADTVALVARNDSELVAGPRIYRFRVDGTRDEPGVEVVDPSYSSNGAEFWPRNRSPRDPPGPNRPEWSRHVGHYEVTAYGTRWTVAIYLRDGYLETSWRGGLRLKQFGPRLFVTPEGEVVEFTERGDLILGNRRFRRSGAR